MAQLYREAGRVVEEVSRGVGFKAALYGASARAGCDPRAVCKLAAQALKRRRDLEQALRQCGLDCGGLLLVMAYDLLLGRGLKGGGLLSRQLREKRPQLQAALAADEEDGCEMDVLPRYVRVNRLKTSAASLKARLQAALQAQLESSRNGKLELAEVQEDPLVPDLLVLHAEARSFLQKLPEVATGEAVLQDRSSCLAALAAGLTPGTFCLDACAAPGSKTCHAVEVLGRGRLIACERDEQRAGALLRRLKGLVSFREGATAPAESTCLAAGQKVRGRCGKVRVELRVKDFLETRPWLKPWSQVEVLLVDPSCSGSGLPEHGFDAKPHGQSRLRRLAAFQQRILRHALQFPKARTVVYSTCSLHRLENEDVVEQVLQECPDFAVKEALSWWPNVLPSEAVKGKRPWPSWARFCLRSDPVHHRCRGFFLCRLDRRAAGAPAASAPPEPPQPEAPPAPAEAAPAPAEAAPGKAKRRRRLGDRRLGQIV
ncbi:unnamed protein product [Effrenium voratum]|nr:unnamed protein product [Effrenium voratum]